MEKSQQLLLGGWVCVIFESLSYIAADFNNFNFELNLLGNLFLALAICFFLSVFFMLIYERKIMLRKFDWQMKMLHNKRIDEEVEKEMCYKKKYDELTTQQKKKINEIYRKTK
jgi:hypothetical protein